MFLRPSKLERLNTYKTVSSINKLVSRTFDYTDCYSGRKNRILKRCKSCPDVTWFIDCLVQFRYRNSLITSAVYDDAFRNRKAKSSSSTGTQSNVGYRIFRTPQRKEDSNDHSCDTEIQLLPEHEEVGPDGRSY